MHSGLQVVQQGAIWCRRNMWARKPVRVSVRRSKALLKQFHHAWIPIGIAPSVTVPRSVPPTRLSNANYFVSRLAWARCINPSTPYINIWSSSAPTGKQQACVSSSCTTWHHLCFPSSRHQYSFTWKVILSERSELSGFLWWLFVTAGELSDEKLCCSAPPDLFSFSGFCMNLTSVLISLCVIEISNL
jgi:hypothetical protein